MLKFLHSPLFRCLICAILIGCILVNCSPLRADAFAGGAAVTAIVGAAAAVTVVAGVMMALGVMPDSANTAAFETVVNGCTSALTSSGVFLNGLVTVLQLSDGVVTRNHVNEGIVEAILDWLFSSETVKVKNAIAPDGCAYYNGFLLPDLSSIPDFSSYSKAIITFASSNPNLYLFKESATFKVAEGRNGNLYVSGYENSDFVRYHFSVGTWNYLTSGNYDSVDFAKISDISWSNFDICSITGNGDLSFAGSEPTSTLVDTTIATGLIAGQIGADIETDYETWVEDGVVAVDFGIGYVDDPNTENDDDDDEDGDTETGSSNPKDPVTPENPVQPSTTPSPWWKDNKWLNIGGGIIGAGLGELTYQLLNQTQNDIQTGTGNPEDIVDSSLRSV